MPISLTDFYSLLNQPNLHNDDVVSVNQRGAPEIKAKSKTDFEAEKAKLSRQVNLNVRRNNRHSVDAFIASLENTYGRDSEFMRRLDVMALRNIRDAGKPLRTRHIRAIQNADPAPRSKSRLVSIGGGPRGLSQASEELKFLKKHEADFVALRRLGGNPCMTTTVIDRGKFDDFGRGAAWTEQNTVGTVNTGAESGYEGRLLAYYRTHKDEILAELKEHPVARAMFRAALTEGEDGSILIDRAALTRAIQGREEQEHFRNLLGILDDDELSGMYKLVLLPETEVTGIDISNPGVPEVKTGSGTLPADTVRLNTGTVSAPPLDPSKQQDVLKHSYIGPMDSEKVKEKLGAEGLLDEKGMLKPGAKILTGGSSLSLYDQLLTLHPVMDLFEEDETSMTGYKVTDAARVKHKDSILVTSNTPGKWVPPRHSHGLAWTQKLKPISGIKEQHALFLHGQGEEVHRAWQKIVEGSVAATTGRTPGQVRQENYSTGQLLEEAHNETRKHAEALKVRGEAKPEHTLFGARRQGYISTLTGFGMEADLGEASREMYELAPHTFKGREGYLIFRAQLTGISEPGTAVAENNDDMVQTLNTRMQDIIASPFRVHEMMHMLKEAGIVRYTTGSYSDIKANTGDAHKALLFTDKQGETTKHDMFLVSPTFQRSADPVVRSLAGKVDPVHPEVPDYGKVGPHRMLQKEGAPVHVEDYGLTGRGARVGRSTLGIFANDVSNRESAVTIAPGLAYRRFAQAAMETAGYDNPVAVVDDLYDKQLPSDAEYTKEVQKFEPHYNEGMRIARYLEIIEDEAGDNPDKYLELYNKGRTEQGRLENGGTKYKEAIKPIKTGQDQPAGVKKGIPVYEPQSREAYFKRYVDTPDAIHEMVYTKASLMAAHRLLENGKRQPAGNLTGSVDDLPARRTRLADQYIYDAFGLISD